MTHKVKGKKEYDILNSKISVQGRSDELSTTSDRSSKIKTEN